MAPNGTFSLFARCEGYGGLDTVEEACLTESNSSSNSRNKSFHLMNVALGAGLLALCGYVTVTGLQVRWARRNVATQQQTSMLSLFEAPDFHDACAEALLQADGRWDERSTRVAVGRFARRRVAEPEMARNLQQRWLTPDRRDSLLHVVRHSMDREVQEFGRKFGRIVAQSSDKEEAVRSVQQVATGDQIRRLRDVLFPVASGQHRHEFKLHPSKMQLLQTYDEWHPVVAAEGRLLQSEPTAAVATPTAAPTEPPTLGTVGQPSAPPTLSSNAEALAGSPTEQAAPTLAPTTMTVATATTFVTTTTTTKAVPGWKKWWNKATEHHLEEALDILADLVLEADNILSNLDMVGSTFQNEGRLDRGIPYWSKSLMGGASSLLGISKCFVEADDDRMGQDTGVFSQGNFMLCSMQYAESVADFLSAVDDVMGFSSSGSSDFFGRAAETTTTAASSYWAYSR